MLERPSKTSKCTVCRTVVLHQVYLQYRGRCVDCCITNGELTGTARDIALAEHLAWIERYGSLRVAIEVSERAGDDSPIGRWAAANRKRVAERRAIRNSKIAESVKRQKRAAKRMAKHAARLRLVG